MKIEIMQIGNITPEEIGKVLSDATPEEFAEVFFSLATNYEEDSKLPCGSDKLDSFGKAMAPALGAKRKVPLVAVYKAMKFYEMLAEKEKCDDR